MAKTWSADNPKAALMARKQAVIVEAALKAFLDLGYAEASVNRIAATAGVSIKTLYRHFESKDDLFSAVMQAACGKMPGADLPEAPPPAWYDVPPIKALPKAGEEYLRHVLSQDQLALYRVVTRDAHRFPELGRRYHEETTGTRADKFAAYLDLWAKREGWTVRDKRAAAQVFAALLKARIFDEVLLGLREPSEAAIVEKARDAAKTMLLLLNDGGF
jgi:TetR/AcrR family transcriptional repressor of mexJK operon